MIRLYLAIGVALALGAGALWVKSLRAENARLTQAYAIAAKTAIDNKAALDAQIAERARLDAILTQREQTLARIRKTNQVLDDALNALKNAHQDVRDWSDARIPADVLRLFQRDPVAGKSGNSPPDPAVPPH